MRRLGAVGKEISLLVLHRNRKLDKSKATGRIDGMVAMTMSVGAANGEVTEQGGDFDDFIFRPL
ncbi:hypothetical protein EOL30_30580, partial [Citrobacter freundii]